MNATIARNILLMMLSFLGLSALGGGFLLIISPSGHLIGDLPLSILARSPFNDFLIPGILLFIFIGLVPVLLVFALLRRPTCQLAEQLNFFKDMHWSWSFNIYVAFSLIIWIQVETIYVQGGGFTRLGCSRLSDVCKVEHFGFKYFLVRLPASSQYAPLT